MELSQVGAGYRIVTEPRHMARAQRGHRNRILRRSPRSSRGSRPVAAHPPDRADRLPAAGRSRRRRRADRRRVGDRRSDRRRTAPLGPRRHGSRRSSHARAAVVPRARHHVVARSMPGLLDVGADDVYDIDVSRSQPSFQLVGRPDHASIDLAILRAKGARVVGRAARRSTARGCGSTTTSSRPRRRPTRSWRCC